ncbi:SMU1112c/YaeR family gloxylase I-like metalloprotein [Fructilactobacillus sp. Tb1]|uniref:SMU1112c/YaeR family gloxylase I-like metalloprotein n=1 Tax=Fructilactobacillus sp. Tb1 TaxID=3422304 RepID=UPI003D2C3ACE
MRLNKIHHIAIIGSDYEKSLHFYVDILGLTVIQEHHRVAKNDYKIDLQINANTELELFIKSDAPKRVSYPEAQGLRHLAFATDNIEADIAFLKAQGVKVDELRTDDHTKDKMVFFYDPDNLPIELHE